MHVLQLSLTDVAGMPMRIKKALRSVNVSCDTVSYQTCSFSSDVVNPAPDNLRRLIALSDIIHCHCAVTYHCFKDVIGDKPCLLHIHGAPERGTGYRPQIPHVVATPDLLPEFPQSVYMPNIVLADTLPESSPIGAGPVKIFKSPSHHDKHEDIFRKMITPILTRLKAHVEYVNPQKILPHEDLVSIRSQCHISFDHMHGYFGLESLESLAQGLIAINGATEAALNATAEKVGERPPFEIARTPVQLGHLVFSLVQSAIEEPLKFDAWRSSGPRYIAEHYNKKNLAQQWTSIYEQIIKNGALQPDMDTPKFQEIFTEELRPKETPSPLDDIPKVGVPKIDTNEEAYRADQVKSHENTYTHETDAGRVSFLKALIRLFPEPVDHLLEIGCYNGMETIHLTEVAKRITGIELGKPYLKNAKGRDIPGFNPLCMDMHSLAFKSGTFDAVFANNVIEHAHDPQLVITEIFRVLKPGGLVIAAIPPDALGEHDIPYHLWKATPLEIANAFFLFSRNNEIWDIRPFGIPSPASDWKMMVIVGVSPIWHRGLVG